MPRLSDVIRNGESALQREREQAEQERAARENAAQESAGEPPAGSEGGSVPPPGGQGVSRDKMRDFPILTQIYNEVGVVATVVDKIDQISAFIQAFARGEEVLQKPPPAREAPPGARPAPARAERREAPPARPAAPEPEPEPEPEAASEEEIEALYDQLYAFVETTMKSARSGQPFEIDRAFLLIARIVDLPRATDVLYRKAIYTRESGDRHEFESAVVLHSVNVAIYALKIGEGLGYNRDQLIDLGVAALLHDVGMVTLPPDIFSKGQLSDTDKAALRQHPNRGHQILSRLGEDYEWLAQVALQEHEREDGSGYPQGLKGNEIHQYAKIVGVADTYAGFTRSRPERRGLLPFEAVKEILQTHKPKFDSRVVRVLLGKLSAFPIGSLVQLNSGAVGTVVETDEAYPLRPVIRILYDAQNRRIEEDRVINLREYPILHIADAIYEEDIAQ